MNKPHETHPTREGEAAAAAERAGENWQHTASLAAVARHKGETPRTDYWRGQLAAVGGIDNGLVNIPAFGVREIIDDLEKVEREPAALERQHEADCATMAKQAVRIDALDCRDREGGTTMHCRHDSPCVTCQLAAANKRSDEAIRRLLYMHHSNAESVQYYKNSAAQALKSLGALPDKLTFDVDQNG